jgi:putative oxidoreductase
VVATFSSHRYWDFSDAVMRRSQESNFYKNVAILGGFCFLFACGGGQFSIDGWLRRRR